jgi:hypothetical protein
MEYLKYPTQIDEANLISLWKNRKKYLSAIINSFKEI